MTPFLLTLCKHSLLAAAVLALAAITKPLWRERYGARSRCALWLALAVFLLLPGKRIYSKKQVTNPVRVWYTKYYNLVKTNLPGRGLQTLTPRCCRVLPEVLDYEFHIEPYAPPAGYAVFAAGAFLCGSTARPC